jgi:RNA polymerase sigma-70 factor (ECF subfamily)
MTVVPSKRRFEAEPATDAALIARIPGGDLGALGVLYDRHALAVWRVVHRVMNSANDVDDVVHATFLTVPALAESFDGRPSARSWLIGVAVRLALRHMRGVGRFTRMLARFGHVARTADHLDPEVQVAGRAKLATLERAVSELPVAKRAVFVMVEMEGLSHEEVARELDIPLPTVRTRLFHAKRELECALRAAERP